MLATVLSRMGKVGLKAQKYIPEIAMGVGAACVVIGGVKCCKETLKVGDILDETKELLEEVYEEAENDESISKSDIGRKVSKIYFRAGLSLARNFGPGLTFAIGGLASMFYGFGVLDARYVGTVVYAKGLEVAYDRLERGVVDKYGKDIRDELVHGITRDDVEYEEIDEEGNSKIRKAKKAHIIPEDYSSYAVLFDSSNPNWEKNAAYNLMWLRGIENYMNDLLNSRGHVFLNDVLDALGFSRTPDGAIRGWIKGIDDYISFGIDWEDGEKHPSVRRFLNGLEPSVWLDFNLAKGNTSLIWDKI